MIFASVKTWKAVLGSPTDHLQIFTNGSPAVGWYSLTSVSVNQFLLLYIGYHSFHSGACLSLMVAYIMLSPRRMAVPELAASWTQDRVLWIATLAVLPVRAAWESARGTLGMLSWPGLSSTSASWPRWWSCSGVFASSVPSCWSHR